MDQYGDQIKETSKKINQHENIKELNRKMNEEIDSVGMDPKPKKPLTIYFMFRGDETKAIKEKNKDIGRDEMN